MEYYYYNTTTGEFAGSKATQITIEGYSSTTVQPPTCDHGDVYPDYIEKAVFDSETQTWTKVSID